MNDERGSVRPMRPFIGPPETSARAAATQRLYGAGDTMEREINEAAAQAHSRALLLRTAARQDATVVVARARERGGASPTAWSAFDADAVHLIADLLLRLQGQGHTPLDPVFQTRGDGGERIMEANPGRAESGPDTQSDGPSQT